MDKNESSSKIRQLGLGIAVGLIVLVYIGQAFSLQVVQQLDFQNRVASLSSRVYTLPATRGRIISADSNSVLATNEDSFAIYLTPEDVGRENANYLAKKLSSDLNVSEVTIERRMSQINWSSFQPVELLDGLSLSQISAIAEQSYDFPGITWQSKPLRSYPMGEMASHVVGYVGSITSEELVVLFNEGYNNASELGKAGLEFQYENVLRGKDGFESYKIDARGRLLSSEPELKVAPVQGNDVVVSLDLELQSLAEAALGQRVGAIVALNPENGEIKAMVSYPRFDPNIFQSNDDNDRLQGLMTSTVSPFINRAIGSAGPPASTFKLFIAAALLNEDIGYENHSITCEGSVLIGNRRFYCHNRAGHGSLDLRGAISESCNVYFYTIATEILGVSGIHDMATSFNLGEFSQIDLPGERAGLIPDAQWKEVNYDQPWLGGDTANYSIGQGFTLTTPIQLAVATSMIYNDGVAYVPHLLKEVRDPVSGQTLRRFQPEVLLENDLDPYAYQVIREGMRMVTREGTAQYVLTSEDVSVAAKTGTGQSGISEDNKHSWIVAYAPYEDSSASLEPLVLVAWIDATNPWEYWAPKAANVILHGYYRGLSFDESIRDLRVQYIFEDDQ